MGGMHNNQVYLFSTPVAVYTWVSLCKSLPATPTSDSQMEADEETEEWSAYIKEYDEMHEQSSRLGTNPQPILQPVIHI